MYIWLLIYNILKILVNTPYTKSRFVKKQQHPDDWHKMATSIKNNEKWNFEFCNERLRNEWNSEITEWYNNTQIFKKKKKYVPPSVEDTGLNPVHLSREQN